MDQSTSRDCCSACSVDLGYHPRGKPLDAVKVLARRPPGKADAQLGETGPTKLLYHLSHLLRRLWITHRGHCRLVHLDAVADASQGTLGLPDGKRVAKLQGFRIPAACRGLFFDLADGNPEVIR